ncbi:MAG: methyltransferase domain-containing protein [Chloroflexota bacterium]|nr:methyltransferase domain-containing protein [Chloroflexota bacterium]
MTNDVLSELREELATEGAFRCHYTRRAFLMLPPLDRPRILDVGCGYGGPTVELARLSRGHVVGLDIDQQRLDRLARKAAEQGLAERVTPVHGSMFEMDFPEGSFDVIWAEGSIWLIGFERGLREWRRFLKQDGFLVVHEMAWLRPDPPEEVRRYWDGVYPGIRCVEEYLEEVPACGYDVVGYFALPEDAWWTEYYAPLERRIGELRTKYAGNREALAVLDGQQAEVELFRNHMAWYGSAFFVMRKGGAPR